MKGYVVTLFNVPESINVAERCIYSGKKFNIDIEMFPAVHKDVAYIEMSKEKLTLSQFDNSFSDIKAVVGNFVTQYRIWKQIIKNNEPAIVLEHDAIIIDNIPNTIHKGNIVNLGKPSFGKFKEKDKPGIYPLFSKAGGYIPGAHGYYVTPIGAQQLVDKAHSNGISPCDIFLNTKNFDIKEIYPWVIEAHDTFTTIQNEKGCKAKHNFNQSYKIL